MYDKDKIEEFLLGHGVSVDDALAHHGIMGMHWGIRRFQPYSTVPRGSGKGGKEIGDAARRKSRRNKTVRVARKAVRRNKLTPKKRRQIERDVSYEVAKSITKAETERLINKQLDKALPKSKRDKQRYERDKAEALKSGTASDILRFKGDLTNEELRKAKERLNLEKDLQGLQEYERQAAARKVQKVFDTVDSVQKYTETSIRAYNSFAKVANSLGGKNLPIITDKKGNDISKNPKAAAYAMQAIKKYNSAKAEAENDYYRNPIKNEAGAILTKENKERYDQAIKDAEKELTRAKQFARNYQDIEKITLGYDPDDKND